MKITWQEYLASDTTETGILNGSLDEIIKKLGVKCYQN